MSNFDVIVSNSESALFCAIFMRKVHLEFGLPCWKRALDGLFKQHVDLDWSEFQHCCARVLLVCTLNKCKCTVTSTWMIEPTSEG